MDRTSTFVEVVAKPALQSVSLVGVAVTVILGAAYAEAGDAVSSATSFAAAAGLSWVLWATCRRDVASMLVRRSKGPQAMRDRYVPGSAVESVAA